MVHIRRGGGGWRAPLLLLGAALLCQQLAASEAAWLDQASPDIVTQWAERIGKTLSDLGRKVTRVTEIKNMYKKIGATIEMRDGETLVSQIKEDIEKLVQEKMASVKCLMEWAEEESFVPPVDWDELLEREEEDGVMFSYRSSKLSPLGTAEEFPQPTPEPPLNYTTGIAHYRKTVPPVYYQPLELNPEPHFFNIPVDVNFSTVHVPTNVFDRGPEVIEDIQWSKKLDPIFSSNYAADPSLTWQYFGSAKGFLRTYPGMQWRSDGVDLYDCRMQPWYISAVTCSKEVVLLVDTSGSMTGLRFSIARLVANSLLDTFTSNDFISVLTFADTVSTPIPCFEDMLVQATKENVMAFKEALSNMTLDGYGNFSIAFSSAFQLLESYRDGRGREGCDSCNQAIMLITDGVPGNLTEVFETYNRFNDTGEMQIPVRVFTYLLGKEVTNVREIQWMACLNRGWYTHMQSLEEVREEALRYMNVIARPMVLQGDQHPIVWSHAYADFQDKKVSPWLKEVMGQDMDRENQLAFSQAEEDRHFVIGADEASVIGRKVQRYQLLTSVSIPVFDVNGNLRPNESRSADLLGVAGLDVPLKLFQQKTKPYKIGVNGYAFMVTNNGYILMHPELRPVVDGFPRNNFNSVDLTEIESVDDGSEEPRVLNPEMLKLRNSMVAHEQGSQLDIKIKTAFDEQRRLSVETRDFYYTPVAGTPFSLGISLPPNYGTYSIDVGDKFRKIEKAGITSANYFHGNNWRIHPDWVYCRYAHDSLKNFTSAEERLMHFFRRKDNAEDKWQWVSDPPAPPVVEEGERDPSCGRSPVPEGSYYCDKEILMQLLFEAKTVNNWYGTDVWELRDLKEREAVENFNVSMRFIATHSGLTRWQHAAEMGATESGFGDFNNRAIEEDWYKGAVLLHEESPDSILFSVPYDAGNDPEVPVTAYTAIYHHDGGHEVPAAVAGFKLPLHKLQQHMLTVTEGYAAPSCVNRTGNLDACGCASEEIACYMLDANGFVVVSEEFNDTGRFFGDVAPDAMVALKKIGAYRQMVVYDYQSMCITQVRVNSGAAELILTPLRWIQGFFGYLISQFLQIAVNNYMWTPVNAGGNTFYDDDDYDDIPDGGPVDTPEVDYDHKREYFTIRVDTDPCDRVRLLALLNLTTKDGAVVYDEPEEEVLLQLTSTMPPLDAAELDAEQMQADEPAVEKEVQEVEHETNFEGEVKYETENVDDAEVNTEEEELPTEEPTEKPFVFHSRNVVAKRVPHTNLLLVVVDGLSREEDPGPERWSAGAEVVDYANVTHPCQKLPLNDLPRRRLEGCISSHSLEAEIEKCGRATPSGATLGIGLLIFSLVASMLRIESLLF